MIIFDADHPLVLNGTYDIEGYTKSDRRRQRAMAKKATRTTPAQERAMRTQEPRSARPAKEALPGRVNIHRGDGGLSASVEVAPASTTVGEAMRQALEDLGEVVIDDTLAPAQMRELAEIYEDVARRQAVFAQKADEAKTAKKSLESVTALLLTRVREMTHPVSLPLFDAEQAEQDQAAMTADEA